jgi:tripartite-type tricarboxylate transporter receptor subunit TctC
MKLFSMLFALAFGWSLQGFQAAHGADAYPSHPLRIICPYPAGGASDVLSRAIAHELEKELHTGVIVENRPGGGSTIGSEAGARAEPDGYTLTMTSSPLFAVVPKIYTKLSYDPLKAFDSVIVLASFANVLVVNPKVPAHTVKELIDLAKAHPGTLSYASTGYGSTVHLSAEMFRSMAGGLDIVHVPYKGSPPAVLDLLAGQVQLMFNNLPNVIGQIKAGQLRALAVTGARREPELPDVPTMAEAGLPGYEAVGWFSLSVPHGTPPQIVTRLNAAAANGIRSPDFIRQVKDVSFQIIGGTSAQMDKMIGDEVERWGPVVKASGAKVD